MTPLPQLCFSFFFFNDTATTEIYTLSLHDALPISGNLGFVRDLSSIDPEIRAIVNSQEIQPSLLVLIDRKSTRLNSSHGYISYAVFCLKKKKKPIPRSQVTLHSQLVSRSR